MQAQQTRIETKSLNQQSEQIMPSTLYLNSIRGLGCKLLNLVGICIIAFATSTNSINPPVLTPVSTNSGNTGPTYLGNSLTSTSSLFFTTSANLSLSVIAGRDPSADDAYLAAFVTADSAASDSVVLYGLQLRDIETVGGLAMKDPLKVFVADLTKKRFRLMQIQNSSGVFAAQTLQTDKSNDSPNDLGRISAGLGINSKTYAVLWGTQNTRDIWRYDFSSFGAARRDFSDGVWPTSNSTFEQEIDFQPAFGVALYKTDFVVVSMSNTPSIPVIKYSDFSVQYVLNRSSGCSAYASVFDNLSDQSLFELWDKGDSYGYFVDVDVGKKPSLHKNFPDLALPDTIYSNILNFGPYQYVAVITGQGATLPWAFAFIYKANNTFAPGFNLDFPATVDFTKRSLLGVKSFDTLHYFSFIDIDASQDANFHSYYLELDRCNERDAVDPTICLRCIEPFVRNTADPSNICLVESDYPYRQGPNKILNLLQDCQQTDCLKCRSSYLECQICDLSQQMYLNSTGDKLCYSYDSISLLSSPYWGVTVKNGEGIVTKCANGCTNCLSNQTFCESCDVPVYFLDVAGGKCFNSTTCPTGKGINTNTNTLVNCQSVNCTNCCNDSTVCSECAGPEVFLWTIEGSPRCLHYSDALPGFGANITSNTFVPCKETGCISCSQNYQNCLACNTTSDYYRNSSSDECLKWQILPSGLGGNFQTGSIESCFVSHCIDCRQDYQICKVCNKTSGYFLEANQRNCTYFTDISTGQGADLSSGKVVPCQSAGCLDCHANHLNCNLCDISRLTMLVGTNCISASESQPRTGMNLIDSKNTPCQDLNCLNCSLNSKICIACDETNGYFLEGEVCKRALGKLKITTNPSKSENVGISFILAVQPWGDQRITEETYSILKLHLKVAISFIANRTQTRSDVKIETIRTNTSGWLQLDLIFTEVPAESEYTIEISTPFLLQFEAAANTVQKITIFGSNASVPHRNTANLRAIQSAEAAGQVASNFIGGPGSGSVASGTTLIAIVSLDPSGSMMRFTQILKIMNKLYYFNINFGEKLKAFLAQLKSMESSQSVHSANFVIKHSRNYRGKLSQSFVEIDGPQLLGVRVFVYSGSWTLKLLAAIAIKLLRLPKMIIQIFYWTGRIHLIVFNVLFIDVVWYCSRTLLHTTGLSNPTLTVAAGCLLLVSMDLFQVLASTYDSSGWFMFAQKDLQYQQALKTISSAQLPEASPCSNQHMKRKDSASLLMVGSKNSAQQQVVPSEQVNYTATYGWLSANPHLLMLMASPLQPARCLQSVLCRSLLLVHVFRLAFYQLVILSCQYASTLGIGLLVVVELGKPLLVVYCYVKYKYLKNIICLLMEVSQSIFLTLFLGLALLISPKRFDEPVIDFYQDAGIWIVIASCVAEYLLLITYITVAAYEFIKNRKARNQARALAKDSVIKYGRDVQGTLATEGVQIYTHWAYGRVQANSAVKAGLKKLIVSQQMLNLAKPPLASSGFQHNMNSVNIQENETKKSSCDGMVSPLSRGINLLDAGKENLPINSARLGLRQSQGTESSSQKTILASPLKLAIRPKPSHLKKMPLTVSKKHKKPNKQN